MALWTPDRLGAAVLAWWDAAVGTSTTTDGVGIAQWDDRSGTGNHAVQATGANQPTYVAVGPAVRFLDASNLFFDVTTLSTSELNRTFAGIVHINAAPGVSLLLGASAAGGLSFRVPGTSSKLELAKDAAADFAASTGNVVTGSPSLVHETVIGTDWVAGINGAYNAGTHAQTLTADRTTLFGKFQGGTGNDFDGDVKELLVCTGLVEADRHRLDGYLAHRHGTTLAAGHPYEDDPPTGGGGHTGLRYPLGGGLRQRTLG